MAYERGWQMEMFPRATRSNRLEREWEAIDWLFDGTDDPGDLQEAVDPDPSYKDPMRLKAILDEWGWY